ncbi:MAG: hypothetical protein M1480_16965 [Bacteroidetes bacterium]|nr:hypothetical protein [Bacteroidota bacterium]
MKLKLIYKLSVLLLIFILTAQVHAKGGVKSSSDNSLKKTLQTKSVTKLNINNISTFIQGDGISDVTGSNPGYFYPTLGGMTANFESGFVWGGYIGNSLRVGGSTYRTSLTPGKILDDGTAEDPNGSNVRIFRVRRDYKTGSLSTEVQDEGGSEDAIRAQYEKDWNEWPADRGAPYDDVDHDGRYEPDIDIPGVPGADQTIWWVANDLNATAAARFYGTVPMGVEVQCTVWGYKSTGALGNMFFKKYIMINKNKDHQDFTKFYVSYWDDIDIGGGSSDFNGCDTTLNLGYIYSGIANNAQYGITPPATGLSFFQGPRIKTGNPQDTAIFKGKYVTGYKNLPMTSYFMFVNSDATFGDPDLNSSLGTQQFYNLMQGFIGSTGQPFIDPKTGKATKFPVSGDPLTNSGWVDGDRAPSDRRMGEASGPFTLAYGDTQEVVIAEISAGNTPNVDNVHAVGVLKDYAKIAQIAYNRFFKLPASAPQPKLQVSELNQKLVLNWGFDEDAVTKTENYDYNLAGTHYTFQGYNVYQLPSASATLAQAKKIATYDIKDSVTVITDLATDPASGKLLPVVVANGTNSGIVRYMVDSVDAFTNSKFLNGSRYYFAVTSYSYNPNPPFGAKVLENALSIITATPHSNDPGVVYSSSPGDTVKVTKVSGTSDGTVNVNVVDPTKATGHNYQVSFFDDSASGSTLWKLTDVTSNTVKITDQHQSQGASAPIVDGVQIKVAGPALLGTKFSSTGNRWLTGTPSNGGELMFGSAFVGPNFWGATTVAPGDLRSVHVDVSKVQSYTDVNGNGKYDVGEPYIVDPAKGQMVNFYTTWGGGHWEKTGLMPMKFYAIEPDGSKRQLDVVVRDRDKNGQWDPDDGGKYAYNYVFVLNTTYDPTGNHWNPTNGGRDFMDEILNDGGPVLWTFWWYPRGTNEQFANDFTMDFTAPKVNTNKDVFSFTAPNVTYNADVAKADIDRINVFPNPYYGVNPQELDKYSRWVTFTHLPVNATIRIFNLAGQLVRTIQKSSNDQFQRWNLMTDNNYPVASGLYIVYIDMPDLGKSKVLKVAIIQEQQILDRF